MALKFACLELGEAFVLSHIGRAIEAGARAVFIAEPAANRVYVSPIRLDAGSDVFERCVIGPNRRLARRLTDHGVERRFHCCGALSDAMLDAFCTLRPALLSLGGSRRLGEDAARAPRDTVLYGNLPSRLFYSDAFRSKTRVAGPASVLAAQRRASGHPFILGTECDTFHLGDYASFIGSTIDRLLEAWSRSPPPPPTNHRLAFLLHKDGPYGPPSWSSMFPGRGVSLHHQDGPYGPS